MKQIFSIILLFSFNSFANTGVTVAPHTKLICYDRSAPNDRIPLITATIVNSTTLADIVDSGYQLDGSIVGVYSKFATTYKNHLYFRYVINSAQIELLLPDTFAKNRQDYNTISQTKPNHGSVQTKLTCQAN